MKTVKRVDGEMDRSIERRKSERIKCNKFILHDTNPGDFFYRGKVRNYSKQGLYIQSNVDLLPEDEITILAKKNSDDLTYVLNVKIKWVKELKDPKFDLGYGTSIIGNIEKRTGKDRRVFKYTEYIPERRSGLDRRNGN